MNYAAAVTRSVSAMRAEPQSGSEQVSQAVIGEIVQVSEEKGEYALAHTPDGYQGWIARRHLCILPASQTLWTAPASLHTVAAPFTALRKQPEGEMLALLPMGAMLQVSENQPQYAEWRAVESPLRMEQAGELTAGWVRASDMLAAPLGKTCISFHTETAARLAKEVQGVPYLWGGVTPFGFDCSGFVQRIYRLMNVMLPRDACDQALCPLGTLLPDQTEMQAGDLIFFCGQNNPHKRNISHVALALGQTHYIHAVGGEGVVATPFNDDFYSARYEQRGRWRYSPPGE